MSSLKSRSRKYPEDRIDIYAMVRLCSRWCIRTTDVASAGNRTCGASRADRVPTDAARSRAGETSSDGHAAGHRRVQSSDAEPRIAGRFTGRRSLENQNGGSALAWPDL